MVGTDLSSRGAPNHAWKVSSPIIRAKENSAPTRSQWSGILCAKIAPLNIDQLNWPTDELQSESQQHLWKLRPPSVHELLRLRNGRSCMLTMIQQLHHAPQLQTAFFEPLGSTFRDSSTWINGGRWRAVQISQHEPFSFPRAEEQWRSDRAVLKHVRLKSCNHQRNSGQGPTHPAGYYQRLEYPDQRSLLSQKIIQLRSAAGIAPGAPAL